MTCILLRWWRGAQRGPRWWHDRRTLHQTSDHSCFPPENTPDDRRRPGVPRCGRWHCQQGRWGCAISMSHGHPKAAWVCSSAPGGRKGHQDLPWDRGAPRVSPGQPGGAVAEEAVEMPQVGGWAQPISICLGELLCSSPPARTRGARPMSSAAAAQGWVREKGLAWSSTPFHPGEEAGAGEHRKSPSAPWLELAAGPYIRFKPWQAPPISSSLGAPALPFHKTGPV